LKRAEGVVKLVVCNPNENKEQKEKEKDDSSASVVQKTPQKSEALGKFNDVIKVSVSFTENLITRFVFKTMILHDLHLILRYCNVSDRQGSGETRREEGSKDLYDRGRQAGDDRVSEREESRYRFLHRWWF